MKIKGHKIEKLNVEIIPIPRSDGEDLIFKAQAVLETDEFTQLCPEPKPPMIMRRGETKASPNTEDESYQEKIEKYNELYIHWMFLKSISATEDLEWETIKMDDPTTWANYEAELKAAKFSNVEILRLIRGVQIANSLDERRVEEARKRFLVGQQAQVTTQ